MGNFLQMLCAELEEENEDTDERTRNDTVCQAGRGMR
jgi:hypothetical protein